MAAVSAAVGCVVGSERIFSYYPGMLWSRITICSALCPIKIEGLENIPKDKYCVIAANHQSAFDIWALYGYLGVSFKWVLKGALSKIPFVGWACRRCGFIFVDNSSPEKAASVISEAKNVLHNQYHIFIFPEGTRSPNGKLQKFKRGAFKIALDTSVPVVPVSINGAYEVMNKRTFLPTWGRMRVTVHPAIDNSLYSSDAKGMISFANDVRDKILEGLDDQYR